MLNQPDIVTPIKYISLVECYHAIFNWELQKEPSIFRNQIVQCLTILHKVPDIKNFLHTFSSMQDVTASVERPDTKRLLTSKDVFGK